MRLALCVGVKVMLSVHDPPGATPVQLCVAEKSASELAAEDIVSEALPVLFNRYAAGDVDVPTVCGGKSSPLLPNEMAGEAGANPVALRLLRSGLPTTLEETTSSPL